MPCANCESPYSSYPPFRYLNSPSVSESEMSNNILNIPSPKLSAQSNSIAKSEKLLSREASLNWNSENTVGFPFVISTPSNGTPAPKSSDALRKEIATPESETLHLERYILSLYRTAFEVHLAAFSNVPRNHLHFKKVSLSQAVAKQSHDNLKPHVGKGNYIYDQPSPHMVGPVQMTRVILLAYIQHRRGIKRMPILVAAALQITSGASCLLDSLCTPDGLSDDTLKCISSIYCRLANPHNSHRGLLSSPASSLSSSSIFSSCNPCDNWSPQYCEDAIVHCQGLKEEGGPYAAMVEVLKICLDDMIVSIMLCNAKKIQYLMRFPWHAYLAYGTHNGVKGASILKAAYNIGGNCITACTIKNSIFRIRSHHSELDPEKHYRKEV